jgi:hypothetical protein
VTKIGAWCFKDCKSLSRVTFEMGSQLREIGREALDGSPKARILLPKGKELSARESWQGWKSKSPSAP